VENDRRLVRVLFFAVVTVVAPARAQTAPAIPPPAPASPAPAPASPAPASPPAVAGETARAEALFQEGKRLLEQGKTDAACTLLAQSDAAEPAVSTLGLLAACHEQQGRLATASREYRETVRRATAAGDSRGEFARQRAAELAPRLPRLVIRLAAPDPGVELSRDGEPVPASEVGLEVPVDPGRHEIVARAPGRRDQRVVVLAVEGAAVTAFVPALALLAPPPPPVPAAPLPVAAKGASVRRPVGFILGGAGLAGLGMGIGLGVSARDANLASQKIHDTCAAPGMPPDACATGRALRSSAFTAATASTVGLVVGAVGVGAGLVLVFWPSSGAPAPGPARTGLYVTPLTGPRGGGAALGGAF
jgi:hypothetical protein